MQEDSHTEFKREVSDKIARAAVAFSNTDGGTIYVGIEDDGTVIGVEDTDSVSIRCTQLLMDTVRPEIIMRAKIDPIVIDGKDVVRIEVMEGIEKPYYLRDRGMRAEGVYIRRGTMNVPVSEEMFKMMLRRVRSRSYEDSPSFRQDLTFDFATNVFRRQGVKFGDEQKAMLHLIEDGIYSNLGFMLSDQFDVPFKAALFPDEYKDSFLDRAEYSGSVLEQFDGISRFVDGHNTTRSTIDGYERSDITAYPIRAVRETILNAIIHRDYTMDGPILLSMFPERLTVSSPGGLNEDYTMQDLELGVSSSRNRHLADIFYRLKYVEAYGTGIPRIMSSYRGTDEKPEITVTSSTFFVSLPSRLKPVDEVEDLLSRANSVTRADFESLGMSRTDALSKIKELIDNGRLVATSGGRSTAYRVIHERRERIGY